MTPVVDTNARIGEHETKFVLANSKSRQVRQWLQRFCLPDPQYGDGHISSIYFDSRDFLFLQEKLSSDYRKTKIRLRWYAKTQDGALFDPCFLEIKEKIGSARKKMRLRYDTDAHTISRLPLHSPTLLAVNRSIGAAGVTLPTTVYPTFIISYRRTRYIDPLSGARLCLDSDIHVPAVNRTMVSAQRKTPLATAVFEYKETTGELPEWLHQIVALADCRRTAFSKYSSCYAHLHQILY